MDIATTDALRVAAGTISLISLLICLRLGRHGRLSFRYTLGWTALFGVGTISALLLPVVESFADALNMSPAALVAILGLLLLLVICVQLSISISGIQEQMRRLSENIALLEASIDRMTDDSSK